MKCGRLNRHLSVLLANLQPSCILHMGTTMILWGRLLSWEISLACHLSYIEFVVVKLITFPFVSGYVGLWFTRCKLFAFIILFVALLSLLSTFPTCQPITMPNLTMGKVYQCNGLPIQSTLQGHHSSEPQEHAHIESWTSWDYCASSLALCDWIVTE